MNRLSQEKSPYLLQHAENPVNWYPWCDEAFAEARRRNMPIFLSIGYSVCHWCHVMAHESFEDIKVAKLLNDNFIAIKVDREERPDVDSVYMSVCQAMTGSGGWPLTIFMTPSKEPFLAATYLPKNSRYGVPGLIELLTAVSKKWKSDKGSLIAQGQQVTSFLQGEETRQTGRIMSPEGLLQEALDQFNKNFDSLHGGFAPAPKFPCPHNLLFLLERKNEVCLNMGITTLSQMYRGGIFDHIGGGFCRYSTDDFWLVPHFEKMLYDNALLIMAYCEGFKKTKDPLYRQIAERTIDYVLRELGDKEGGFYCGQDAGSEGVEGKYYVFTPEEIRRVLGKEAGKAFCHRYDINERGNFEGKSIPNLLTVEDFHQTPKEYQLLKLYHYRKGRMSLHKDDKILTSWNGLMIAALARASRIMERPELLEAAQKCVDFIWRNLYKEQGRLKARYRDGQADFEGTLDDYCFLAFGLLECYEVTFDIMYLEKAIVISHILLSDFFDRENGGFYLYGKNGEQLITRPKETYDGAIPSGNAVAAMVLDKLAFFTGSEIWRSAYEKQSDFMQSQSSSYPAGHGFYLWHLAQKAEKAGQLICVFHHEPDDETLKELHKLELPTLIKTEENADDLAHLAPFTKDYPLPEEGAMYYLCKDHTCSPPTSSLASLCL